MRADRKDRCRGSALLEFTLVGIGIIFVLISIFEISRGMWLYNTLAHTAKEAVRFAIVHGENCDPNCLKSLNDLATVIESNGVGLQRDELQVRLSTVCDQPPPTACGNAGSYQTLNSMFGNVSVWPPNDGSQNLRNTTIEVQLRYPFRSALAFFWTGVGGQNYGLITLGALSRETIQY